MVSLPPQKPTSSNSNSTRKARTPLNEFLGLFGASWVNKLHLHLWLQTKELSTLCSSGFASSFTRFFVRSFFTGERSVDSFIVYSVILPSVCSSGFSFARSSASAFVSGSGLFGCSSVCSVLLASHVDKHVINN